MLRMLSFLLCAILFLIFASFLKLNPKNHTIVDEHRHELKSKNHTIVDEHRHKILVILIFSWWFNMSYLQSLHCHNLHFITIIIQLIMMVVFIIATRENFYEAIIDKRFHEKAIWNQDKQISSCSSYMHLKRWIERYNEIELTFDTPFAFNTWISSISQI
jgi:hypothetical protein